MNDFYRKTGWSKGISHMLSVINQPLLKELGANGRSVIPKSTIDWRIKENMEADFELDPEDMKGIERLDAKARFNDPSLDYQWRLYSDLEGIEGTVEGKTH
ncbi:hypothetical protein S40285_09623 [Stachybotrys chlorohalonatus IBT 40285]|uniref:Uncharacterized protein n=1 Tax=Stachybotrys chlorohalonatus (strain IBT 40285) TaxID=1283841 RepID=A0A084QRJ0_STAC4|nr:hypothetical protein S40285_09623 [Stachybotrys chlorohalonata IBT 40285]